MKCITVKKNSSRYLKMNGDVILSSLDRKQIEGFNKQSISKNQR